MNWRVYFHGMYCGFLLGVALSLIFIPKFAHAQYGPDDMWLSEPPTFIIVSDLPGDVDKDGFHTNADAILIKELMENIWRFDVNGDTKINQKDIDFLNNYIYNKGAAPTGSKMCRDISVKRPCIGNKPAKCCCKK